MTEIQIGDVVYLDREFCWDADMHGYLLRSHACFDGWYAFSEATYRWLLRTKWVVLAINEDIVMAECRMFLDRPADLFHLYELEPTGERIIPNDPSRYDRTLL